MMDAKVSKDKHITRWVDRENLIYVLDKIEQNMSIMTKKVINRGKRSKTLCKNTSTNLQSFLEISPVQKEVLLSHKLQNHAIYE